MTNKSIDLVRMPTCNHDDCQESGYESATEIYNSGEICCTENPCQCEEINLGCLHTTGEGDTMNTQEAIVAEHMNSLSESATKQFCNWTAQMHISYAEASVEWVKAELRSKIEKHLRNLDVETLVNIERETELLASKEDVE